MSLPVRFHFRRYSSPVTGPLGLPILLGLRSTSFVTNGVNCGLDQHHCSLHPCGHNTTTCIVDIKEIGHTAKFLGIAGTM